MTTAVALAVLALADCVLCGFRGAAGTEGRLDKRIYYREAVLRAFGGGVVLVGAHALLVAVLVLSSGDPQLVWSSFLAAGRVCVWVYGLFATTIFTAFAFFFAPVGDFRVLTNVVVFGPLTVARPYVMAGGLLAAVAFVPDLRVGIVAASAAVTMLSFQSVVSRRYADRWRRLLEP
jgi:hypothetical protein